MCKLAGGTLKNGGFSIFKNRHSLLRMRVQHWWWFSGYFKWQERSVLSLIPTREFHFCVSYPPLRCALEFVMFHLHFGRSLLRVLEPLRVNHLCLLSAFLTRVAVMSLKRHQVRQKARPYFHQLTHWVIKKRGLCLQSLRNTYSYSPNRHQFLASLFSSLLGVIFILKFDKRRTTRFLSFKKLLGYR